MSNGASTAEAIERWLGARQTVGEGEADEAMERVRRTLRRLTETSLVRNDWLAATITEQMARADDMDELTAALERLDARVAVLLGRKRAAQPEAPRRAARTMLRL